MNLSFLESGRIEQTRGRVVASILDAARNGRLAIVGSALLPQKCLRGLRSVGGDVRAFIEYDARFWGRIIDGVPVLSPEAAFQLIGSESVVVSGVWSPNHRYADTRGWISTFGFEAVYPV